MELTRRGVVLGASAFAGTSALAAGATNVADLGIVPNAGSDQTPALQLAIDVAQKKGLDLYLPPGKYIASGLSVTKPLAILGTPGRSLLLSADGDAVIRAAAVKHLTLYGLSFDGQSRVPAEARRQALVVAESCEHLLIEGCQFLGGATSGLALFDSAGRVTGCRFGFVEETGIFCFDSRGVEVSNNHVHDIGNNGIQIWRTNQAEDGAIVTGNRVERVAAKDGGTGQNGNGINVWKAGNVLIANNRVSDCAFSAIRNNSGSNCQIVNNSCSRTNEKAIYVEFAYEGAVVAGNLIEDVAFGISITNLDYNGRLVTCSHNLIRKVRGGIDPPTGGSGIAAEGEVAVVGNVIEDARDHGIGLGWGPHCRNLSATGNIVRNCGIGISVSLAEGAQPALIANNIISGSKKAAVLGMDHREAVTADLALVGATVPKQVLVQGNLIT
jgi:uncharacterized secreted repeat protein (TIGR03808 family)